MEAKKFKYQIDLADGRVMKWGRDDSDDLFAYANTVKEVKDVLASEAFNYEQLAKEFREYAKNFKASDI